MSLTQCNNWLLKDAGYEHHCFISYPRLKNAPLTECAQCVKDAIVTDLATLVDEPKVFLDTNMPGGTDWEKTLKRALCRSLAMVALCAPIYYDKSHIWCGLEWAAMESLGNKRLPGMEIRLIIPLIVRESNPYPKPVSSIQYINISSALITRARYYTTREFRLRIREVVNIIERIAVALAKGNVIADCNEFELPPDSVFATCEPPPQPYPFRSNG
jgi:hypothetical protein